MNTSSNSNPIILIEKNIGDIEIFKVAHEELGIENELIVFENAHTFFDYISTTKDKVLFILCDINMHILDGFEIKKMIFDDEELRLKCIPFLILSSSGVSEVVMKAYSLNVQGFFVKGDTVDSIIKMLEKIIDYWSISLSPYNQR